MALFQHVLYCIPYLFLECVCFVCCGTLMSVLSKLKKLFNYFPLFVAFYD